MINYQFDALMTGVLEKVKMKCVLLSKVYVLYWISGFFTQEKYYIIKPPANIGEIPEEVSNINIIGTHENRSNQAALHF